MCKRDDLNFLIITKCIIFHAMAARRNWSDRYNNVTICCTVENQTCANYRRPIYKTSPIKHKITICEPLLESIDLQPFRYRLMVEQVVVGGESGYGARPCNFDWIMNLRSVCVKNKVTFGFKHTGAKFIKDGKLYSIKRQYQYSQARKAGKNI